MNNGSCFLIAQLGSFGYNSFLATIFYKLDTGSHFGCHTSFGKLTISKMLFDLRNINSAQFFLSGFVEVDINIGYIGKYAEFVGFDFVCQQGR